MNCDVNNDMSTVMVMFAIATFLLGLAIGGRVERWDCATQSIADKKNDWWLKAVYAAQLRKEKPNV